MAELRDTIQGVVLSEKATSDHLMANNTYTFRVGINSNKTEIKQAIQQLFGVRVQAVRTLIMYGDIRRVGRHSGKQSNWKKAYVKLHEDDSLQHLFIQEEEE